jgi:hypothetical protein
MDMESIIWSYFKTKVTFLNSYVATSSCEPKPRPAGQFQYQHSAALLSLRPVCQNNFCMVLVIVPLPVNHARCMAMPSGSKRVTDNHGDNLPRQLPRPVAVCSLLLPGPVCREVKDSLWSVSDQKTLWSLLGWSEKCHIDTLTKSCEQIWRNGDFFILWKGRFFMELCDFLIAWCI